MTGIDESNVKRAKLFGAVVVKIVPTRSDFQPKPARNMSSPPPGRSSRTLTKSTDSDERDGAHGVVEQPFEIGLGQRALAELSQRFLVLGAAAQLVFQVDAPGNVVAEADDARGGAVCDGDRPGRLDPAFVTAVPVRRAVARAERRPGAQRLLEQGFDGGPIVGVNACDEGRIAAVEAAGRHAVNRFKIARPRHRVGGDVPRPNADLGGFERGANRGNFRKKFFRRPLARPIRRCSELAFIGHIHAVTLPPNLAAVKIVIAVANEKRPERD